MQLRGIAMVVMVPDHPSLRPGICLSCRDRRISLALPRMVLCAFALGMIAFHNLFDNVDPASLGAFGWLWQVLHVRSYL